MNTGKEKIEKILNENTVVLFMKGTAEFPQCGFSAQAVEVLRRSGKPFFTVDVMSDRDIRAAIKDYANWPTLPQLYVRKELIGGCDIMVDMYQAGELQELLASV